MVEFGNESQPSRDDGFEHELRDGLRPRSAPAGFADRVLAHVDALPPREPTPWPQRVIRNPLVRGVIAATLLLSVGVGGYFEHQRERQIAGEQARQQVLLALRITGSTLQDVRNKVDGSNANQEHTN